MGSNYMSKQDVITRNYNHIYAHELAHQKAGGRYAGDIVIERNNEGIPVGGHVNIQMPVFNKQNPQKTINHADTVIKAALAPGDPSEQDYRVAAKAREVKSRALAYKAEHQGKHLDVVA